MSSIDKKLGDSVCDNGFESPFGRFNLQRIPNTDKNLQAWNSADLYILKQLSEWQDSGKIDLHKANILIVNDSFGALATALSKFNCDSYSDSFISHEATILNIKNNCPENLQNISLVKSTDTLENKYDLVLFKEVKSHVFLKHEMLHILKCLSPNALILGGIMAKNLQKNTLEMLNTVLGSAHASLTWKKSKLLFVAPHVVEPDLSLQHSKASNTDSVSTFQIDKSKEIIYNQANVFSRNKLDIGTRFFIEHIPTHHSQNKKPFKNIIDLGCGNGILSLKAAQKNPQANITCIDESYMAVASAKMTLDANLKSHQSDIRYIAANALSGYEPGSADLILCNPPFHQQYVVGDAIAWQMFKQSERVLEKGGELWIVGNRHLGYHLKLKKIFGNQSLIATNNKFVIIKAVKK